LYHTVWIIDDIFHLAEQQNLFVRTSDGKVFRVAEVKDEDEADGFAHEIVLTRNFAALRELPVERSKEPGSHSLDEVRQKLGLPACSE
jgi:hypothetical protein